MARLTRRDIRALKRLIGREEPKPSWRIVEHSPGEPDPVAAPGERLLIVERLTPSPEPVAAASPSAPRPASERVREPSTRPPDVPDGEGVSQLRNGYGADHAAGTSAGEATPDPEGDDEALDRIEAMVRDLERRLGTAP